MTPRERVRAALRHRPPDRVPWGELVVPPALAAARAGRAPRDGLERLVMQRELQEELGIDLAVVDAGGCLQQGVKAAAMREVRFWAGESDRFVVALLPGGLSWARDLLGWQELFRQLARQQAQLEELFQQAHLALARAAGPLCAAGVEMVMVADDIAHRQGPLADPHYLRRAYFPSLAGAVAGVASHGGTAAFHSEGDLTLLVEDIVAAGFSALHSIEAASGMSLAALRRQYHGRLCLMGNLDLHVLLTADGAELELAVRQVLAEGNGQGGFIFGTSGGLTAEVELERLRLVARCLAESGSRG